MGLLVILDKSSICRWGTSFDLRDMKPSGFYSYGIGLLPPPFRAKSILIDPPYWTWKSQLLGCCYLLLPDARSFHLRLTKGIRLVATSWYLLLFVTVKLKRAKWRASTQDKSFRLTVSSSDPVHKVQTNSKNLSPRSSAGRALERMHSWWNHCLHLSHWSIFLYQSPDSPQ